MGNAVPMEHLPPDENAYGRITHPESFGVVVDAAFALVDALGETFALERAAGGLDGLTVRGDMVAEVIRLCPAAGVPLTVVVTTFPGVILRFGEWGEEAFPGCGCDACDEQPAELIDRMTDLVAIAAAGGYEEELTKRKLRHTFRGKTSSESHLGRNEWRRLGKPGLHRWPAWPYR